MVSWSQGACLTLLLVITCYSWLCLIFQMLQDREVNQLDLPHARFQRTDQWIPVYSWLETLDKDEVVKSKEISDWLTQNPKVQEQLCSRHSRYHLMHYIKKCHLKILKRREKRKVLNSFSPFVLFLKYFRRAVLWIFSSIDSDALIWHSSVFCR